MLYTGPGLTDPQANAIHSKRGKSQGRHTLRRRSRGHSPAQPFPSPPFFGPPFELPGTGTRNFLRLLSQVWKHGLSPAQKAAFSAIAASQPVTDNNGTVRLVRPFQWFTWYNSVNYFNTFGPSYPIDPVNFPPLMNPPPVWDPPATPSAETAFVDQGNLLWQFNITSTPNTTFGFAMLLIPYWRHHNRQTTPIPSIRTNAFPTSSSDAGGVLSMNVSFSGIVPSMKYVSGKQICFRLTSPAPNYVPSDPYFFTWP